MLIAHIADSHITGNGPGRAARLDDLQACVDDIRRHDPAPDAVVHCGDVVHNGRPEEYALAREILARLPAPLYVMPGNKDDRRALSEAFPDCLPGAAGSDFLQYAVELDGVRLVAIDTRGAQGHKGELCRSRLAHLDRLLGDAGDRPTLLAMHHPPYAATAAPDPYQFANWETVSELASLLERHRQVVHVLSGHIHRDTAGAIASVAASSVTSIATDLRKGSYPAEIAERPFYHLLDVEPTTGQVTVARQTPCRQAELIEFG